MGSRSQGLVSESHYTERRELSGNSFSPFEVKFSSSIK